MTLQSKLWTPLSSLSSSKKQRMSARHVLPESNCNILRHPANKRTDIHTQIHTHSPMVSGNRNKSQKKPEKQGLTSTVPESPAKLSPVLQVQEAHIFPSADAVYTVASCLITGSSTDISGSFSTLINLHQMQYKQSDQN